MSVLIRKQEDGHRGGNEGILLSSNRGRSVQVLRQRPVRGPRESEAVRMVFDEEMARQSPPGTSTTSPRWRVWEPPHEALEGERRFDWRRRLKYAMMSAARGTTPACPCALKKRWTSSIRERGDCRGAPHRGCKEALHPAALHPAAHPVRKGGTEWGGGRPLPRGPTHVRWSMRS